MKKPVSKKKPVAKKATPARKKKYVPTGRPRGNPNPPRKQKPAPGELPDYQITPQVLSCYVYHLHGMTALDIAAQTGIHRNTVGRYIKKVEILLNARIDKDKLTRSMLLFLPLAMKSTEHNLQACDGAFTTNYLKGVGVYQKDSAEAQPINLNVNIQELREKNQREGFAKLGVRIDDGD